MRRIVWGVLLTLMCSGVASSGQAPDSGDVHAALVELEQSWNEAFYSKDVPTIANILAEEFIATYDDGRRGDKDTELAAVLDFNQQVLSAIQDDFTIQVYGETAIVWFTLNLVGLRGGEPAEVGFRFTDVFVWRDDRWQCVSSQSTRIGER